MPSDWEQLTHKLAARGQLGSLYQIERNVLRTMKNTRMRENTLRAHYL